MKRRFYEMEFENNIKSKVCLVERNPQPQGVTQVNPFAVARVDRSDLVELAQEIQKADSYVRATTCSKLQVIAEQVRFLQQQAEKILLDAKESTGLHHAACNFRKQPGHTYYLYKRPSGQLYFSMLSLDDWSNKAPHEYLGSYRLESDMSWTPEAKMEQRTDELTLLNRILDKSQQLKAVTYYTGVESKVGDEKMDST